MEPNTDNVAVTGHLTFLGKGGESLKGKEVDLRAPLTKGQPNYVPTAITTTVGKNCTVIAEVDKETYNADHGIMFLTTSKAQLITNSAAAL
jgi:hypothetical protein